MDSFHQMSQKTECFGQQNEESSTEIIFPLFSFSAFFSFPLLICVLTQIAPSSVTFCTAHAETPTIEAVLQMSELTFLLMVEYPLRKVSTFLFNTELQVHKFSSILISKITFTQVGSPQSP